MNKLKGIIPAVITPTDEAGNIEFSLLEKQVNYLVDAGVNGLFVAGGTGEGAYLSTEEKIAVLSAIKEFVGSRVFLCAASINSNTRATIEEMKALEKYEPDYLVATPPYYHAMTQNDIIDHYKKITDSISVPLIIYNIPSTTHNPISIETISIISKLPHIAGVKDSSGDFCSFSRGLLGPRSSEFAFIQGEDYLCGPSFLTGADGVVSGLSNARVEPYVAMFKAAQAHDWDTVKNCQAQINDLYEIIRYSGCGNAAIKAVATLAGRSTLWMRQVSQTLTSQQYERIQEIMNTYDEKYGS